MTDHRSHPVGASAQELIRAARAMDAAGVPPDAPPEAISAVVLVLRQIAIDATKDERATDA